MYAVKAFVDDKEYVLHDPKQNLFVGDGYFENGDNINGQAEFTVYPDHPYYEYVKKLTTDVVFYNDGDPEFYGRILYDDEDDFSGAKQVFCEGELAFFCDSIQPIKKYQDVTVSQYLKDLLDIHNSQVEERKQFTLGRVTVTDSNDSLYRYSNYNSTRDLLKDRLSDRLGGHFVVRHENGIRYLDYLSDEDFYRKNSQTIEFGKNLLDFARNMDASEVATRIIPLGAVLENDSDKVGVLDARLTIADVNGGVIYVTDTNAVKEFGKITKAVIWDDVTVPANLMKKGQEYLKSVQYEKMVLELKAIDMNLLDKQIEEFQIGDKIRCISKQNGLDREFPLTKKKIYISDFSKNTVTLGDSTSAKTYTSSNAQNTAEMEETINSLPSKREILQEAITEAQKLINAQVKNGHAIHVPEEFIVSDDEEYKTKATYLWRWGLGGLAHYSQGYDGPIDGVALTMDGKINGKMLLANSVVAESIDAEYKKEVETSISNAQTNATTASNDYTDRKEKLLKETISTSIKNTESKIVLSASSLKEYVSRKNYIVHGEQETLALSKFTVSGTNSSVTVTEAEYLNMKCFKIAFKAAGTVTIKQSVGNLEEGTYTIAADGAYPSGKRPNTVRVGFDGNLTSFDLSSYTFEEFHLYKKEVKITAAAKTVAVTVQGSAGSEYYVTNIRCLRDLTEMIDNVSAKITTEANRITAEVNSKFKNYLTTEEINSKIEVAQESILLNVSQNYTTKDQSKQLYQDAVNNTTTQLQNYVSTASLEAKLKVEADSIKSSVKADISTSYVSKDNLKEQLTAYATTKQVQSAINQQASSITAQVTQNISETYITKSDVDVRFEDAEKAWKGTANTAKSDAISTAAQDATSKANKALQDANSATDGKLQDYTKITQMQSAIQLAADRINMSVYSKVYYNYCTNGSFSKDCSGWAGTAPGGSSLGSKKNYTYDGKTCALITDIDNKLYSPNSAIWSYELDNKMSIEVVLKLALKGTTGQEENSVEIKMDSTVIKSIPRKDLSKQWTEVTVDAVELEAGTHKLCITPTKNGNYTGVYITDVGIYAYRSDQTEAKFSVLSASISSEITRAKGAEEELSSKISQTAESISTKVEKSGIISAINQTAETISIKASKIDFNGMITANSYFQIKTDGSFVAKKGTIGDFTIKDGKISTGYATLSMRSHAFVFNYGLEIRPGTSKFSDGSDAFKVFNLTHVTSGGHMVFGNDGATVCYLSSSSKRYKDHIADMTLNEAKKILDVPVIWFKYKENYLSPTDWLNGKKLPGFYAEDVYAALPEAAQINENGEPEDWNFRVIIPAMLKLIQNLYERT